MNTKNIVQIIEFWLGDSITSPKLALERKDFWYKGGDNIDDEIHRRFSNLVSRACDRELVAWSNEQNGALALIILLDQFTRNLFRNTPKAYSGDIHALDILNKSIDRALDRELSPVPRIWFYHPLHHSEQISQQDKGLKLLEELKKESLVKWHSYIDRSIAGWTNHRNIVSRFGRFPHRNDVLGRTSTKDELSFLTTSGQSFGQGPKRIKD